MKFQVLH